VEFLWNVTKDFSQLSKSFGKITQALRTITLPVDIQDHPHARSLSVSKGEIAFKNVRFHYKGATPLFENKTVVIQPGQKVGLVGFSGSGKTTFVNLILRLFDVTHGQILIDGQDIRMVTQDSLHEAIGVIPQDPSLFNRTLRENIRYGRLSATDADVELAARKAHAHSFIKDLPNQYDTAVGERGIKLSGGQRQRIAIARVVLKNAPILILDEATSQLDSITETLIQESIEDLMQNKTTLVIAHRLSTLLHMDRILVFDKGKIIQDGTHQELMAQNGLYKTLWEAQVGGFLPERISYS
jgi:ATP-binding cassette subfamily B protein